MTFRGFFLRALPKTVVVLLPALSYLPVIAGQRHQVPSLVWPPIGSSSEFAGGLAVILIWIVGRLPTLSRSRANSRKLRAFTLAAAVIGLAVYVVFLALRVKGVDTPLDGRQYRTVGSVRTPVALRCGTDSSDEDLLSCGGLEDGDIERMWTPSSVVHSRLELFFAYVFTLSFINILLTSVKVDGKRLR